jgi:NADH-quinone oxidoreductase subunit N
MIISTIYVLFICWDKYFKYKISNYEYSLLILLSLLGLLLIVSAKDLLVVYLAVELISLSLYVLAGIQRTSVRSSEAGLKYFVLGGLSSGLLLFGTAVLYISTGTTNMVEMGLIGADTM